MKKIFIAALLLISFSAVRSQTEGTNLFGLAWDISFPTNNDYLTEPSLSGFRVDYKRFLSPKLSVGLALSWNSYSQYIPTQTYSRERTAVTTDMDRTIYNFPMAATAHYYFGKGGSSKFLPFAGIALGAQYSDQSIYYNIYVTQETNWGFLARPEIGTYYKFNDNFAIVLSGTFAYASNKNDAFNISSLNNFGIHLGVAWMR